MMDFLKRNGSSADPQTLDAFEEARRALGKAARASLTASTEIDPTTRGIQGLHDRAADIIDAIGAAHPRDVEARIISSRLRSKASVPFAEAMATATQPPTTEVARVSLPSTAMTLGPKVREI